MKLKEGQFIDIIDETGGYTIGGPVTIKFYRNRDRWLRNVLKWLWRF